jgi:hypothetical protein
MAESEFDGIKQALTGGPSVVIPGFMVDLRRLRGYVISEDQDSGDFLVTIICEEYPGGFGLLMDASTECAFSGGGRFVAVDRPTDEFPPDRARGAGGGDS